ncbi:MAG: FAD-binding oxidoreductase [Gammaproteobacteria bacterium]|nr:FAD-binding oxidoreductase [Gammaproteobacteria bacterium]
MIRKISQQDSLSPTVSNFCKALKYYVSGDGSTFTGDIDTSYSSRISLATDNSIYQAIPQGVLFPKSTQDIEIITSVANQQEFSSIKFSPRGGGTGTNGQSLTEHMIVDMSRYMREILEINLEEKWVKVQAGVIKDQLNDFLRPHGFFFAPDLSTSNRATVGGMINTDASGQGSLVYGKTSDHVLGITAVTIAGDTLRTEQQTTENAKQLATGTDRIAKIYQQVLDTATTQREKILETFPRLNRFLTGYDLENVYNQDLSKFDLSRVLTGSEGTLAFITEAKLNITPIAKFKTLINIKYDSFDSALRNSPFLVEANATSVETIDSKVLNLAKEDVVWDTVSDLIQDVPNKVMDGLNIVEFNDEDESSQATKVDALCQRLDQLIENGEQGVIGYQTTTDLASINKIYGMRKKAVGLLGNAKTSKKPIAFVEDTAVPPENLADYIAEFKQLLDSYKLDYGMFGHVDAGVLHVRPALDLTDPAQEKLLREISDKVVELTAKYGGLMWGEHGKGYRSEYGPDFFGEELFSELRKIKAAFDPNNRLNPGKICTPLNSAEELVSVDGQKRAKFDKQIPVEVKNNFETTINCNGNGLCFNYDASSPMCPSYKASKDRRFSPKGRASLMREWLRLQENIAKTGSRVTKSSGNILSKLVNSAGKLAGQYDYSHEVKESMDECLACKACTTACPIKVDVPTFRTKFIEQYHTRYLRPLSDYLVANVESILPKVGQFPSIANLFASNPVSKWVIKHFVGYVDTPEFSVNLKKHLAKEHWYDKKRIEQLTADQKAKTVFLVQDPFVSYYESELVIDTANALKSLGFHLVMLPFKANGKPQHVKGFLAKFKRTASKATKFFNDIAKHDIPMIGLDASLVFAYRDEYVKALGQDAVQFEVSVLSEWLANQTFDKASATNTDTQFDLLTHCTEKSLMADVTKQWHNIFDKLGLNITAISTGCCGMAGTFGHEKKNQQTSKDIYQLSWQPTLEKLQQPNRETLATGFSCRSQVKRYEGKKLRHPIQVIAQLTQ